MTLSSAAASIHRFPSSTSRWLLLCCGAVLCSAALVRADAPTTPSNDPPQGLFSDTWMAVQLHGQKLGYAHIQMSRQGDEISTSNNVFMRIKRAGTTIDISMVDRSVERIDGTPLRFSSEQKLAQSPIVIEGEIEAGKVKVTTTQFGVKSNQEAEYPAGALMTWGAYLESLKHEVKPGTRISLSMFLPTMALNKGVSTTTEIHEPEEITSADGKTVMAHRATTKTDLNGTVIEQRSWLNSAWEPLKLEMDLLGMTIDMVICDQEYALKDLAGAEMMVNTLVPVGRSIDRQRAHSITYRITADDERFLPEFPETAMQKTVSRGSGEVILQVTRSDHTKLASSRPSTVPAEFEKYLTSSVYVSSADKKVQALAQQAVKEPMHAYRAADLLRQKVSSTIKFKGLGTGFATAAEVCRNRAGDCSEHGVLLAALGRVKNIPTRLVAGLIYVEKFAGQENVMGFHMWSQFWIDGEWVDLDAAWDQTDVDPTHIAFGVGAAEHGAMGLVSSAMLNSGKYRIAIKEVIYKADE